MATTDRPAAAPGPDAAPARRPDKDPEVRLRTLADAGRLSIPFTTGLLVGIVAREMAATTSAHTFVILACLHWARSAWRGPHDADPTHQ